MDKAKRFHIYNGMKKSELLRTALGLAEVATALLEWIDAVPEDTVLPSMPGVDRDWVDSVLGKYPHKGED